MNNKHLESYSTPDLNDFQLCLSTSKTTTRILNKVESSINIKWSFRATFSTQVKTVSRLPTKRYASFDFLQFYRPPNIQTSQVKENNITTYLVRLQQDASKQRGDELK